jgi:hypothetical protein
MDSGTTNTSNASNASPGARATGARHGDPGAEAAWGLGVGVGGKAV